MNKNHTKISKFLSLVLRHQPQTIGLKLDSAGWAEVDELITKMCQYGKQIDRKQLDAVVAQNEKKRFAFDESGRKIRASQGHSIKIDLAYKPVQPPDVLYHGTAKHNLESIYGKGLVKGSRHHVHLSLDQETAFKVGSRHGYPVILEIDTLQMYTDGHVFFCAENGVWLTEHVPVDYLKKNSDWIE